MKGHRIVKDREGNIVEVHKMVGDRNTIIKYPTAKPVAVSKPAMSATKKRKGRGK